MLCNFKINKLKEINTIPIHPNFQLVHRTSESYRAHNALFSTKTIFKYQSICYLNERSKEKSVYLHSTKKKILFIVYTFLIHN